MKTSPKLITKRNNWNILGKIIAFLGAGVLIVYGVYQFRAWWQGPVIVISSPASGYHTESSIITISGATENIAQLFLMGRPIPLELKTNTFSTELSVPEGVSTLAFDGFSRYNRHVRKTLLIYYTPPRQEISNDPTVEFLKSLKPQQIQFRPGSDIINSIESESR